MNKTFTVLFYLKKPNNYLKRPIPIYIRVTIDGGRFEVQSKRECDPANWNSAKGRMTGSKEEAKQLISYLDLLQNQIFEAQRELMVNGLEVTIHALKNKLVREQKNNPSGL